MVELIGGLLVVLLLVVAVVVARGEDVCANCGRRLDPVEHGVCLDCYLASFR